MTPNDWIRHLEALGAISPGDRPPDPTLLAGDRGEQRLWQACLGQVESTDLLGWISATLGNRRGALLSTDGFLAIEVWTECELAALHALADGQGRLYALLLTPGQTHDIHGARHHGMPSVGVLWGFGGEDEPVQEQGQA